MSAPAAPPLDFVPKGLYIGGAWVGSAGDRTFETINPSTGEKLADVPLAELLLKDFDLKKQ